MGEDAQEECEEKLEEKSSDYESKGYLKRSVLSNLEQIEKIETQIEKAKKKYEETYDEPYVKTSLLKRSRSAVIANEKFKENKKKNAEIRKQQQERSLATVQSITDEILKESLSFTTDSSAEEVVDVQHCSFVYHSPLQRIAECSTGRCKGFPI
jgi:hypothetical protein